MVVAVDQAVAAARERAIRCREAADSAAAAPFHSRRQRVAEDRVAEADPDLPAFARANRVISAVLNEGRNNRVRVFVAPGRVPPAGFSQSTGTLEDAYLVLMRCPSDEIPPALARSAAPALAGGAA